MERSDVSIGSTGTVMSITVCIATCRTELARLLLDDLIVQRRLPKMVCRQRCRWQLAHRRGAATRCRYRFPIHYEVQPAKNISLTRNRTVAAAPVATGFARRRRRATSAAGWASPRLPGDTWPMKMLGQWRASFERCAIVDPSGVLRLSTHEDRDADSVNKLRYGNVRCAAHCCAHSAAVRSATDRPAARWRSARPPRATRRAFHLVRRGRRSRAGRSVALSLRWLALRAMRSGRDYLHLTREFWEFRSADHRGAIPAVRARARTGHAGRTAFARVVAAGSPSRRALAAEGVGESRQADGIRRLALSRIRT